MRGAPSEFVAGLSEQVTALGLLLAAGDVEPLKRAVHQIKGAGGGYGSSPQRIAGRAEQRLSPPEGVPHPGDVADEIQQLIALIRRVEGYAADREDGAAPSHPPGRRRAGSTRTSVRGQTYRARPYFAARAARPWYRRPKGSEHHGRAANTATSKTKRPRHR